MLRALSALGIPSVAVYSDADAALPYLALAGETVRIGAAPRARAISTRSALVDAARQTRRDGDASGLRFPLGKRRIRAARAATRALRFIGPSPQWIDAMGHKTRARASWRGLRHADGPRASVVLPDETRSAAHAAEIGYPVLVKPRGGGGGIGMLPAARTETSCWRRSSGAARWRERGFGNAEVYLERLRGASAPRRIPGARRRARQRARTCSSATARCSGATRK